MASLETDDFLIAVKAALIASDDLGELTTDNVTVWHHGENDPNEDIQAGARKCKGVSALVYDLGGSEADADADAITADAVVELYVMTQKRRGASDRKGGEIRDSIMRCLHRHTTLRNNAAYFDTRVRGYEPLADPEFTAWRIFLSRSIYLTL